MTTEALDTRRIKVQKPRGRHPEKRLTAVKVRNVKQPGRYADGNGLYLFVDDSGARRWILRTVVAGKRRDIGLGSAQLVSLADAREDATRLRRIARTGGDPIAERRRQHQAVPTFREAAKTVHAAHAATFRNAKHRADWLSSLEMYAFPHLAERRIDSITSADVLKALGDVWLTRPETARRVRQRLRTIFDWAKASGFRSGDNPLEGIASALPRHRTEQVHHPALPYAQVPSFFQTLRAADGSESTKLAFEFLILTAARTSEVTGARWEEINRPAKTWTIPATRIKAGREHRVPLSPRCLELLDAAESIADHGSFVFPGRSSQAPLSNMAFLMLLRRIGRDDITAHGFRSSFRDWAAEKTNTPPAVVEAALAHVVKDKTEAAYFRSDLFELRRKIMDNWARFATAKLATVLPIRA